jgi:hypothetical protein
MGGLVGMNGHSLDIASLLDTRKGGYTLAIALAFFYPILRLALDRWVFGVSLRTVTAHASALIVIFELMGNRMSFFMSFC